MPTLVPPGLVFPSFAFRFYTDYGSVTFSGDTQEGENLTNLARESDMLIYEAINVRNGRLAPARVRRLMQSHVDVQEVGAVTVVGVSGRPQPLVPRDAVALHRRCGARRDRHRRHPTRLLLPGLAQLTDPDLPVPSALRTVARNYHGALDQLTHETGLAA